MLTLGISCFSVHTVQDGYRFLRGLIIQDQRQTGVFTHHCPSLSFWECEHRKSLIHSKTWLRVTVILTRRPSHLTALTQWLPLRISYPLKNINLLLYLLKQHGDVGGFHSVTAAPPVHSHLRSKRRTTLRKVAKRTGEEPRSHSVVTSKVHDNRSVWLQS